MNLEGNRIRNFPPEFVKKIADQGGILLTNGNPLLCDCSLTLLQRHFASERPLLSNRSSEYYKQYEDFECILEKDGGKEKKKLKELGEESLICDYSDDPLANVVKIEEEQELEIRNWGQQGNIGQLR